MLRGSDKFDFVKVYAGGSVNVMFQRKCTAIFKENGYVGLGRQTKYCPENPSMHNLQLCKEAITSATPHHAAIQENRQNVCMIKRSFGILVKCGGDGHKEYRRLSLTAFPDSGNGGTSPICYQV